MSFLSTRDAGRDANKKGTESYQIGNFAQYSLRCPNFISRYLTRLAYLATCSTYLVEIYNDLVKQADTFDSLVDVFRVEIRKVGNGSEQDTRVATTLSVQFLQRKDQIKNAKDGSAG